MFDKNNTIEITAEQYKQDINDLLNGYTHPSIFNNLQPDITECYYIFQPEFDAYCRQICFDIEKSLKNNISDLNIVLKWLKSINIIPLPYFLNNYEALITMWYKNSNKKKNYIRILKQRIYNDLIQNKVL
jgi:hypothetical protein